MTLTVLVCVHSTNDFYDNLLIESLKSLEKQTYKDFKTLIVLDQCWNKTENRIKNEITIQYNIISKNIKDGLSSAKNYGLSNIDTDLVCFLDADDLYVENKLEKQIDYFINNNVDFLGREMIATPFIKNSLVRMSKETQTNWKDINVIIYYNNTKDDILMYLFTNKQPNKAITFEYLFGEDI
jgi:glycosyltransferase involved in cell wall biosynthesis